MEKRKPRGVNGRNSNMSLEDKRRQWNVNLSKRTLESLYGEIKVDENTTVSKPLARRGVIYNAQTLYEKGKEYFENIAETNEAGISVIPDIEDFCMFANISRNTFLKYQKSEDLALANVASMLSTAIANIKKQQALNGNMNPTIFAIDFNNNHGYVQARTEVAVNQTISMQQIENNIADIADRIAMEEDGKIEEKI